MGTAIDVLMIILIAFIVLMDMGYRLHQVGLVLDASKLRNVYDVMLIIIFVIFVLWGWVCKLAHIFV